MLWLLGTTAVAAVSGVFADNVAALVPALATPTMRAVVLIAAFAVTGGINLVGVQHGSRLNTIATAAKLAPLLLLVVVGVFFIDGANLTVTAAPTMGTLTRTSILLVFAFSGIESALVPSGEVRDRFCLAGLSFPVVNHGSDRLILATPGGVLVSLKPCAEEAAGTPDAATEKATPAARTQHAATVPVADEQDR
jgi:hypothetical protein